MCFNFHHLKIDYKDGKKWELMEPDLMRLKELFETWGTGMQEGNGWNALFWCNHDQPRIVSRLGDEDRYWKESAEMLAASVHLMRGTPYIYQGEEIGMTNPHFDDIRQYRDVESLNYYRILLEQGKTSREAMDILQARSRDNGRTPVQWNAGENAGFTTGTPWIGIDKNYQTINAAAQRNDPDSILAFYKRLIQLRKEKKVIAEGEIAFLEKENANVLAYRRVLDGEELIVFNNLTGHPAEVHLDEAWKNYSILLTNYEGEKSRTEEALHQASGNTWTLRPYETLTLEK